jgi:hypothetical protein
MVSPGIAEMVDAQFPWEELNVQSWKKSERVIAAAFELAAQVSTKAVDTKMFFIILKSPLKSRVHNALR